MRHISLHGALRLSTSLLMLFTLTVTSGKLLDRVMRWLAQPVHGLSKEEWQSLVKILALTASVLRLLSEHPTMKEHSGGWQYKLLLLLRDLLALLAASK